jgi:hypothetical protein
MSRPVTKIRLRFKPDRVILEALSQSPRGTSYAVDSFVGRCSKRDPQERKAIVEALVAAALNQPKGDG